MSDGQNIEQRDNDEEDDGQDDGGPKWARVNLWEDGLDDVHIITTHEGNDHQRKNNHGYVEHNGEGLVGPGHTGGTVADEQQVLQFFSVFLYDGYANESPQLPVDWL